MSLLLLFKGSGEVGPEPEPTLERIAIAYEYPPDQLAWRINPPNGASSRWAADEPLAENVIDDIRLTDEMPGGDKEGTGVLARNPRTPWPDLAPYSEISVYGPGVEEVGCYRLDKAPESDGERMSISPAAVGWQAALSDDNAVIGPGFIDGDLSKWGEMPVQRRLELEALGIDPNAFSSSVGGQGDGEATAAIVIAATDFGEAAVEWGEQDYYGGGVDIGAVYADFHGAGISEDWSDRIFLGSDSLFTGAIASEDQHGNPANFASVTNSTTGAKYAAVISGYSGSFVGNAPSSRRWANLKVIGFHGLVLQGSWPNVGYTAAQMLGYAIPLHTALTADPEDLEDSGYIVQQAWYSDPGPMAAVVADITKYELLDWFVFGEKRFQMKFPGTYGRKWQAYAGPSGLQEQGLDAARLWREIVVSYQDVDGSTRTVGPPGSGAMVEDAGLEITDPDHPAVRAGITRKDLLALKGIATATRAIEAGERWLQEANLLSRSGSATLSGYALDDRGVYRPVSQLRGGDLVRFPDSGDTSYRKVVRRTYEHNTRTVNVDLDAPAEGMQALLERMQADIQSLQLS